MALELAQSFIPLGQAWITKLIFDLLAASFREGSATKLPSSLILLLVGQIVLATLSLGVGSVRGYLSSELGRHLNLKIQLSVYSKINNLHGLAPFEDPRVQNTIQLAAQGAQMGPNQALGILTSLLQSSVALVSFLGVLLAFSPLLAGLVALAAFPQLYAQIKLGRQRFGLAYENSPRQRLSGYYSYLLSAVSFAKEIRLFNLGKFFLGAYERLTRELNQTQRAQQLRELCWQSGLSLLSNLVSSGTFVVVILQAFAGKISLGDVTFYTSAVGSVQGALSGIVYAIANINESALFFSRYLDLLALPQPIVIPAEPRPSIPLNTGIELHNISFRYSAEHPWVLRNIDLKFPAGKCLALVGLNGAGKTTLVKLLTRLYDPTEGQILWDGIDIREFDPVELRGRMGAIFQDFVRFDLTAFENIALGDVSQLNNGSKPQAEKMAREAARKAGIHETIEKLPQGYDTILSRWLAEDGKGVDLSGGEWQKIALARMFMRDADLLILDEPTAALDVQAEYDIYSRFVELMRGKTSLLISHRFSTVRMADVIAVLEDGRIIEYGGHKQLLARAGTYAKLYNMQADRYR
jgi:ATP-binding cassette subfamily B protein